MVGPRGFEPLTFCTPSKRATSLRYGPIEKQAGKVSATLLTVKKRIKQLFPMGILNPVIFNHRLRP